MRITPVSERMFWVEDFGALSPGRLAAHLNTVLMPEVGEVVAGFDRIGVFGSRSKSVFSWLEESLAGTRLVPSRVHRVPVWYGGGLDFESVAAGLGLSGEELIEAHSGKIYECITLGFQPGFPYLGSLPASISELPRRSEPRTRVPAGSIGIVLNQTGIYPMESPGGWNLIGRTPLVICDEASAFFPIRAGDEVQFYPIGESEFFSLEGVRL